MPHNQFGRRDKGELDEEDDAVAVFSHKCGGYKFKINDQDHMPPHCHVSIDGRNARICLLTLEILNPPPHELPLNVRKCMKELQEEMLEAWESVTIQP